MNDSTIEQVASSEAMDEVQDTPTVMATEQDIDREFLKRIAIKNISSYGIEADSDIVILDKDYEPCLLKNPMYIADCKDRKIYKIPENTHFSQ